MVLTISCPGCGTYNNWSHACICCSTTCRMVSLQYGHFYYYKYCCCKEQQPYLSKMYYSAQKSQCAWNNHWLSWYFSVIDYSQFVSRNSYVPETSGMSCAPNWEVFFSSLEKLSDLYITKHFRAGMVLSLPSICSQ